MKTKQEYIIEAINDNPKPMFYDANNVKIELSDEQYDRAIEAWAEMRVEQDKHVSETETARKSALDKLKALGLTDAEIKALVG